MKTGDAVHDTSRHKLSHWCPYKRFVRSLLNDRILPWTSDQAAEAARLYNATGRIRRLRIDAMIAAAAIVFNAELATANLEDFKPFAPHGLKLLELP